jgi:nucleoid-associated protein YgaU
VAIVVEDRGGSVLCMTQNPGASHYGQITKAGILGYLRPDNQSFFDGDAAPGTPEAPASSASTREIVAGDTLWQIATEEYGDGTRYPEIFNASSFRSGNPNLIFPGEIAVIP